MPTPGLTKSLQMGDVGDGKEGKALKEALGTRQPSKWYLLS